MLGSIGMGELLIIFVIALIVFGPRKLPDLGRTLGKTLGEFKRASNDLRNTLEEEIHVEEQTHKAPAPRASEPASAVPEDDPNNLEEEIHGEQQTSSAPAPSEPASAVPEDDPNNLEEEIHGEQQTSSAPAPSGPAPATPADDPQHGTARSV